MRLAPVCSASSPFSEAITSLSSPMLPMAMTGASVNDFAQPARLRSEPSHSGFQNRRADTWKMSAPAARSMVRRSPSSSGFSTILAS